jgi:N-acetylmuramoyl-L-alanine amidase
MSKYTYLLDNGHGGMVDGQYTTAPKKMFDHGDFVFYEGVFNRKVVKRIAEMLEEEGIKHKIIVPQEEDISLKERVRRANELHLNKEEPVIYISVHANAGGGVGMEIYTSPGQTKSDKVAECFFEAWDEIIPQQRQRVSTGDGDRDKEARFYVLTQTNCPAILTECGFMDNRKEALWMMSDEGIETLAKAHVEGIKLTEQKV